MKGERQTTAKLRLCYRIMLSVLVVNIVFTFYQNHYCIRSLRPSHEHDVDLCYMSCFVDLNQRTQF